MSWEAPSSHMRTMDLLYFWASLMVLAVFSAHAAAIESASRCGMRPVSPAGDTATVRATALEPAWPCASGTCRSLHWVRPQDQIFLISTRQLGCHGCCADMSRLTCRRLAPCEDRCRRRWPAVPLEAFYAADDPDITTIVYVHGNRIEEGEDRERGLMVYRALMAHCTNDAPIRLLIFSWPTTREYRQLKDYRDKAVLADQTAYPLAWVFDRIAPDVRISLVGYSYGARVISGALHYLGGGSQCGCMLGERIHPERTAVRVIFIAAAMNDDWLLPGHRHGVATSRIDRMLLINNQCDPAMKFYHLSSHRSERRRRCRPRALGRCGIPSLHCLGEFTCQVEQLDACCEIGREHGLEYYLAQSRLTCRAWEYASFQEEAALLEEIAEQP